MKCPRCQQENPPQAKFCLECAAPLAESELTTLAQRRGEATVRALNDGASTVAARVEVGATEAASGADRKGVPSRLELGAVGS